MNSVIIRNSHKFKTPLSVVQPPKLQLLTHNVRSLFAGREIEDQSCHSKLVTKKVLSRIGLNIKRNLAQKTRSKKFGDKIFQVKDAEKRNDVEEFQSIRPQSAKKRKCSDAKVSTKLNKALKNFQKNNLESQQQTTLGCRTVSDEHFHKRHTANILAPWVPLTRGQSFIFSKLFIGQRYYVKKPSYDIFSSKNKSEPMLNSKPKSKANFSSRSEPSIDGVEDFTKCQDSFERVTVPVQNKKPIVKTKSADPGFLNVTIKPVPRREIKIKNDEHIEEIVRDILSRQSKHDDNCYKNVYKYGASSHTTSDYTAGNANDEISNFLNTFGIERSHQYVQIPNISRDQLMYKIQKYLDHTQYLVPPRKSNGLDVGYGSSNMSSKPPPEQNTKPRACLMKDEKTKTKSKEIDVRQPRQYLKSEWRPFKIKIGRPTTIKCSKPVEKLKTEVKKEKPKGRVSGTLSNMYKRLFPPKRDFSSRQIYNITAESGTVKSVIPYQKHLNLIRKVPVKSITYKMKPHTCSRLPNSLPLLATKGTSQKILAKSHSHRENCFLPSIRSGYRQYSTFGESGDKNKKENTTSKAVRNESDDKQPSKELSDAEPKSVFAIELEKTVTNVKSPDDCNPPKAKINFPCRPLAPCKRAQLLKDAYTEEPQPLEFNPFAIEAAEKKDPCKPKPKCPKKKKKPCPCPKKKKPKCPKKKPKCPKPKPKCPKPKPKCPKKKKPKCPKPKPKCPKPKPKCPKPKPKCPKKKKCGSIESEPLVLTNYFENAEVERNELLNFTSDTKKPDLILKSDKPDTKKCPSCNKPRKNDGPCKTPYPSPYAVCKPETQEQKDLKKKAKVAALAAELSRIKKEAKAADLSAIKKEAKAVSPSGSQKEVKAPAPAAGSYGKPPGVKAPAPAASTYGKPPEVKASAPSPAPCGKAPEVKAPAPAPCGKAPEIKAQAPAPCGNAQTKKCYTPKKNEKCEELLRKDISLTPCIKHVQLSRQDLSGKRRIADACGNYPSDKSKKFTKLENDQTNASDTIVVFAEYQKYLSKILIDSKEDRGVDKGISYSLAEYERYLSKILNVSREPNQLNNESLVAMADYEKYLSKILNVSKEDNETGIKTKTNEQFPRLSEIMWTPPKTEKEETVKTSDEEYNKLVLELKELEKKQKNLSKEIVINKERESYLIDDPSKKYLKMQDFVAPSTTKKFGIDKLSSKGSQDLEKVDKQNKEATLPSPCKMVCKRMEKTVTSAADKLNFEKLDDGIEKPVSRGKLIIKQLDESNEETSKEKRKCLLKNAEKDEETVSNKKEFSLAERIDANSINKYGRLYLIEPKSEENVNSVSDLTPKEESHKVLSKEIPLTDHETVQQQQEKEVIKKLGDQIEETVSCKNKRRSGIFLIQPKQNKEELLPEQLLTADEEYQEFLKKVIPETDQKSVQPKLQEKDDMQFEEKYMANEEKVEDLPQQTIDTGSGDQQVQYPKVSFDDQYYQCLSKILNKENQIPKTTLKDSVTKSDDKYHQCLSKLLSKSNLDSKVTDMKIKNAAKSSPYVDPKIYKNNIFNEENEDNFKKESSETIQKKVTDLIVKNDEKEATNSRNIEASAKENIETDFTSNISEGSNLVKEKTYNIVQDNGIVRENVTPNESDVNKEINLFNQITDEKTKMCEENFPKNNFIEMAKDTLSTITKKIQGKEYSVSQNISVQENPASENELITKSMNRGVRKSTNNTELIKENIAANAATVEQFENESPIGKQIPISVGTENKFLPMNKTITSNSTITLTVNENSETAILVNTIVKEESKDPAKTLITSLPVKRMENEAAAKDFQSIKENLIPNTTVNKDSGSIKHNLQLTETHQPLKTAKERMQDYRKDIAVGSINKILLGKGTKNNPTVSVSVKRSIETTSKPRLTVKDMVRIADSKGNVLLNSARTNPLTISDQIRITQNKFQKSFNNITSKKNSLSANNATPLTEQKNKEISKSVTQKDDYINLIKNNAAFASSAMPSISEDTASNTASNSAEESSKDSFSVEDISGDRVSSDKPIFDDRVDSYSSKNVQEKTKTSCDEDSVFIKDCAIVANTAVIGDSFTLDEKLAEFKIDDDIFNIDLPISNSSAIEELLSIRESMTLFSKEDQPAIDNMLTNEYRNSAPNSFKDLPAFEDACACEYIPDRKQAAINNDVLAQGDIPEQEDIPAVNHNEYTNDAETISTQGLFKDNFDGSTTQMSEDSERADNNLNYFEEQRETIEPPATLENYYEENEEEFKYHSARHFQEAEPERLTFRDLIRQNTNRQMEQNKEIQEIQSAAPSRGSKKPSSES